MKNKLFKLIAAALFAAIVFIATLVVQIPAVFGYVNLGDCFVALCGAFLGPVYGFAAAGLGSALADLLFGFGIYAPVTFFIKGLMALLIGISAKKGNLTIGRAICLSALGEVFMVVTYFLYECFALGIGFAAISAVPYNAFQGAIGTVAFTVIYSIISKNKRLNEFLKLK
jgi:uncharacterized membrane protein